MRVFLLILMCIGLFGCASIGDIRNTNRENLNKLSLGMTKQDALKIMGQETKRGYCYNAFMNVLTYGIASGCNEQINNPYRSEILKGKDKVFEVLYYYTDMKKGYGGITDDDLTPLVFDDGKLIGWGWSFLQDNVQKYEIRMR